MSDRLTELEVRIEKIEARLDTIEHTRQSPAAQEEVIEQESLRVTSQADAASEDAGFMSLAGRSVLILGGAYLLRALTESALLPQLGGMAFGLLYAVFWMWHGGRAAFADKRPVALFDCATAALIAYPLVWETTTRFQLIDAVVSGALLFLVSVALLLTAARASMPQIAWIASTAGAVAFGAVAVAMRSTLPLMIAATLFAVIAWYVASTHDWLHTAWPAIAASDLLAMALIAAALIGRSPHEGSSVIAGLMIFGTIWIAALCARSLQRRRELNVVEVAQAMQATLIATTGAAVAARLFRVDDTVVGWFSLGLALAMTVVTIAAARRGLRDVPIATSFAAAAAGLLSLPLLFGAAAAALAWSFVGLGAAEWARHSKPLVAGFHAVLWFGAAAVSSGMFLSTIAAFVERSPGSIQLPFAAVAVAALALVAFVRIDAIVEARGAGVVLLAIGALGTFAAAVRLIAGTAGMSDWMKVALMRTIVLAVAAAALGMIGRLMKSRTAARVARAVLVIGGLKLVLEDLRVSSALILVGAFAAYGLAILVVARAPRMWHGAAKHGTPATTG